MKKLKGFAFGAAAIGVVVAGLIVAGATTERVLLVPLAALATWPSLTRPRKLRSGPRGYVVFLPLMTRVRQIALGVAWLGVALAAFHLLQQRIPAVAAFAAVAGVQITAVAATRRRWTPAPVRVAVIGPHDLATNLRQELRDAGRDDAEIVGCVDPDGATPGDGSPEQLGDLGNVDQVVLDHRIDLLLTAPGTPRLRTFEEVSRRCLHIDVRLMDLSAFYEQRLGRVPLAAINAAWFQDLLHPRYDPGPLRLRRALDLAIAVPVGILVSPLLAVLALLVRLDGGPAIYRQRRVGLRGEHFEILKLRSMRPARAEHAQWSSRHDDRITKIGRFLRRTHLDELPQLYNVIRGDMSLVGPRPEQPELVQVLQQEIPLYGVRHLVRPGLTGWAQVRAGYCGSDGGSALKLCYDLYYLKHRSVLLDLMVLGETVRTLASSDQWDTIDVSESFVPQPTRDGNGTAASAPVASPARS